MKKIMQKWWLLLFAAVFSFSIIGCGDITTGNEELDQAIVDMVVDGVNSYLEDSVNGEDSGDLSTTTGAPTPTEKPEPTATKAPTQKPAILMPTATCTLPTAATC